MDRNLPKSAGYFVSVLEQNSDQIRDTVAVSTSALARSPGAGVGAPKGALGQIPANCRLADCCSYAQTNGMNHLSSFARAMDSPAMESIAESLLKKREVIIVDLGSGASLTWILLALALGAAGHTRSLRIVNVDHSPNMHKVSRDIEERLAGHLSRHAPEYVRRQVLRPEGINRFTSGDLEGHPSVFLVLNHLLHQNGSTTLAVPDFVDTALDATMRLAASAESTPVHGISIEPARLTSGFGQAGLRSALDRRGGSASEQSWVAGDRAGKSVMGFTM